MFVNRRIRNPAHHPAQTKVVHWEKRQVKKHESQHELHLSDLLIEHSAKHFRKPEVEGAEKRHDAPPEKDVMNVRDDKVGVVDEQIDGSRSHVNPAESADDEHRNEG